MPVTREERTPPVTKTYLVMCEPRAGNFNFTALGSSFGLPLQRTSQSTAAALPALDEELDEGGALNAGGGVNLRLGLAGTTIGGLTTLAAWPNLPGPKVFVPPFLLGVLTPAVTLPANP